MAAPSLSQKDYLKKYLAGPDKKKKKKRKGVKISESRLKIVDDDLDLKNMRPVEENELDLLHLGEDGPQIAGIIDERPEELKNMEEFGNTKRWRIIGDENGIEDIKIEAVENNHPQKNVDSKLESPKRNNVDSDESPARNRGKSTPSKKCTQNSSDESPSRLSKAKHESSASLSRKSRFHNDSDISPPRNLRRRSPDDSDASPPRKSRIQNDYDKSIPRKSKHRDSDESPPRKFKGKNDSDESPPRKSKKHNTSISQPTRSKTNHLEFPPKKTKKQYDSSESPSRKIVRGKNLKESLSRSSGTAQVSNNLRNTSIEGSRSGKRHARASDSDPSPPRKSSTREMSDLSPSRRRARHDLPQRKLANQAERNSSKHYDSDCSPPRKTTSHQVSSGHGEPSRQRRNNSPHKRQPELHRPTGYNFNNSPPTRSGMQVQVVTAHGKRNNESPKRQRNEVDSLSRRTKRSMGDEHQSHRMEKTLDGKRAGLQDAKELKDEVLSFKKKENEVFSKMGDDVSGRGATAVLRDRKTGKRRNLEEEAKQKQDEEKKTNEHKQKYGRWGKGMKQSETQKKALEEALHEMAKPLARYKNDKDLDQFMRNQERDGDPMAEYMRSKKLAQPEQAKLKYQGSFLPNRFSIPPGYRWDGVDRSCGYEKQWFERLNAKRALEEDAYKWSTSDM